MPLLPTPPLVSKIVVPTAVLPAGGPELKSLIKAAPCNDTQFARAYARVKTENLSKPTFILFGFLGFFPSAETKQHRHTAPQGTHRECLNSNGCIKGLALSARQKWRSASKYARLHQEQRC